MASRIPGRHWDHLVVLPLQTPWKSRMLLFGSTGRLKAGREVRHSEASEWWSFQELWSQLVGLGTELAPVARHLQQGAAVASDAISLQGLAARASVKSKAQAA